jgi:hypothetical protein
MVDIEGSLGRASRRREKSRQETEYGRKDIL